jgi:hypothetical protein
MSGTTHQSGVPERAPRPEPRVAGSDKPYGSAPTYRLHGRYVSRRTFTVPEELASPLRGEPAPAPELPRWYSLVTFVAMSSATIFALCAIGRPGA